MASKRFFGANEHGPLVERQMELAAIIERYCATDGPHPTAIPGLSFYRTSSASGPVCGIYRSVLAVVAQGTKRLALAHETYEYDRSRYLVTSVDLPVMGQVTEASPEQPFLCLVLDLDARKIGELIGAMALSTQPPETVARGMAVAPLTGEILDPVLRLARLAESPRDIPVLAPLIERELLYRLLLGTQGERLRSIGMADGHGHRVARAIDWLKANFDQPLSIDALAGAVNMSKSSLHHHFKALTAMSPLQYQKQIRLQEARRLLIAEAIDASVAARRVGYDSPSQFSREYRRLFGMPPVKDAVRFR